MSKNILCDGLGATVDSELLDFEDKCRDALKDFTNLRRILPDLNGVDPNSLLNINDKLNKINNEINGGLSFGSLGDMARCLGISGVSFDLFGNLFNVPDWGVEALLSRLGCVLENLGGVPLRVILNLTNSLRTHFDFTSIDRLLSLLECIRNKCNRTNYGYPSPEYIEEKLESVGLNLGISVNEDVLFEGVQPPIGWHEGDENIAVPTKWNPEYTNNLNQLSDTYLSTTQNLYKAVNLNPDLTNLANNILRGNKPLCY